MAAITLPLSLPTIKPHLTGRSFVVNLVEKPAPIVEASTSSNTTKTNTRQEDSVDSLISQYFPANAVPIIEKIQHCENGSRIPDRSHVNRDGTVDIGIFQLNSIHKARVGGDLNKFKDAETNIKIASELYLEQGTSPWNSSKACWSKI